MSGRDSSLNNPFVEILRYRLSFLGLYSSERSVIGMDLPPSQLKPSPGSGSDFRNQTQIMRAERYCKVREENGRGQKEFHIIFYHSCF